MGDVCGCPLDAIREFSAVLRWLLRTAPAVVLLGFWTLPAMADAPSSFIDSPSVLTDNPAIFVTGYTCPPYCAPTADGMPVGPGSAACPPSWPFGTEVAIDGVGLVRCDDIYDSTLTERIDVFELTEDDCYQITGWHEYSATLGDGTTISSTAA